MGNATANLVIYLAIMAIVFGSLGWFFVRYVLGRRRMNSGARALGLVNFEYFQHSDGKKAVQEILYTQEAWQEDAEDGDPPDTEGR